MTPTPPVLDVYGALGDLWSRAAGEPGALDRVTLAGPVLPTDFKIGTAASAAIA